MSRMTLAWIAFILGLACTANQGNGPVGNNQPVCGDGVCDATEVNTCPADCGGSNGSAICGDGVCDASEINTCPADCGSGNGSSSAICGNGVCENGENASNCPQDCGSDSGTFDCTSSTTQDACLECFEDDADFGAGACDEFGDAYPGDADDCAMCAAEGTFGICQTECGSGENETCAECIVDDGVLPTFDCGSASTQEACGFCFEDDFFYGVGECDEFGDAFPGSAADCAMCVANGSFGSACETECGSGETEACAQCEYAQSECGDGVCEAEDGENEANCPADCPMLPCGDGICDVQHGETAETCGSDCLLADSFDCSNEPHQIGCQDCFIADSSAEGGMLGDCNADGDVTGGSAADCARCASIGAFGSDCETFCGSGETNTCATCVSEDL